jgi:hypothetical protein
MLVVRLPQLLGVEGMGEWDDVYPSQDREYVGKVITVMRVAMSQPEFAAFLRACGGLRLVVSVAAPDVRNGEFCWRI